MIEIRQVSQRFPSSMGWIDALNNINLSISACEVFGVIGRSGAGKSTLIRTMNLLTRPTDGQVIVNHQDLTLLSKAQLRLARRQIGMIFQHFNLLSSKTVYENVALPLRFAGLSKNKIKQRVMSLLDLVGLAAHYDRYPAQLSGGQKQRVGIARALINQPKVLLCDEATSALDPETTRFILELIAKINREMGVTVVLITHQIEVIKKICDRVAVLDAGRIVEMGEVQDIFMKPRHDVTRALLGDVFVDDLFQMLHDKMANTLEDPNKHLWRLAFQGEDVSRAILSETIRRYELDFSILHGHVDELKGGAFGSLIVLVGGQLAKVEASRLFLREHGVMVEELSYVE